MKNTLRLMLFSVLVASAVSCKKETEKKEPTSTEILIAAQWKKSEFRENGVVQPFYAPCDMDDIISFATNGSFTINYGTNKCNPDQTTFTDYFIVEADNKTMRWGLLGAGEISFNSDKTSFTFKDVGANTFEWTFVKY